jgi:hypothetical protein
MAVERRGAYQITLSILAVTAAGAASAESMKDFWTQRSPIATYTSNKSALALEYCLGLTASEDGTAITLHGEKITLVSITNPNQIISTIMGFRISDKGEQRVVDVFARGSALGTWEKHSRRTAESCV